ncbi:hypothetical protein DFR24_1065 [Panacagrimonas perspica]|uniref:Uncharacterized protein n=1 Tax=Panacagrimonas perspica TaxID=381431 RepID=A0A4R7PCE2_9GAMM|nr:hypothetical protein [Panacagrimonas perspica]TDU31688.1 hypothetical protein DFR24_1065 [Panacagrimonas perspica]
MKSLALIAGVAFILIVIGCASFLLALFGNGIWNRQDARRERGDHAEPEQRKAG